MKRTALPTWRTCLPPCSRGFFGRHATCANCRTRDRRARRRRSESRLRPLLGQDVPAGVLYVRRVPAK